MPCRHAIKRKSNVGMAHATARNFYNDFVRTGFKGEEFAPLQKGTRSLQLEAVRSLDACQLGPLVVGVFLEMQATIASKLTPDSDGGHAPG